MKFVITGGPSVGKTTIVTGLANRGFKVIHEIATAVIKEGKFLPWVDRRKFQAEVLRRQQSAEASILDFSTPVILDRGLFDGEAYYVVDKMPIPQVFDSLDASQYTVAFLIEPLNFFDETDVRRENLQFTQEISIVLEQCYARRNVKVVRVPAMPPSERIDFVHAQVEAYKKTHCFSPEQAALQASHLFRGSAHYVLGAI
jgi:predicted ATPase